VNLNSVPAASEWTSYTQRFFVPANVSEIMISHPFDRVGWLETDTYSLVQLAPSGFDSGMVSITFDDGWRSIYTNALPLMKKYDVVSTQYLVSGFHGTLDEYMTPRQVYQFKQAGHEIGSHTMDHADLTKLSDKDLAKEIETSKKGLDKCFQNVTSFAPPFGSSNGHTLEAVKQAYATSRSTETGFNSPDAINPYQLKVQNVRRDTPPAQVAAWIQTAEQNHIWLILVYHQVSDAPGEYSRKLVDFETDLVLLKQSHLEIMTMHNAYAKTQTNAIEQ
jgi:peptidoglycan/xylan/chitin deacetylase (PgdA/CDA1 family)